LFYSTTASALKSKAATIYPNYVFIYSAKKITSGNNNLSVQKNLEDYIKSGDQVYLKII